MLNEILCDKFISYGNPRGRITFHNGLNVIQGHDSGENSIGKSSFLLAIDFVFGGDDYANDNKIINHIGHHTIKYSFTFNKNKYYFSRNTKNVNMVNECDESYNIIKETPLSQYLSFLLNSYDIKLEDISFRNIVGRYFRIYGRANLNEKLPLANYVGEPDEDSLITLLKLYNLFLPISQFHIENKKKKDNKDAIMKANKFEVVKLVTRLKDYKNNIKRLEELQVQLDALTSRGRDELLSLDPQQAEKAAEYKSKFDSLNKQKRLLWAKYYAIKKSADFTRPATQQDFGELIKYFPNTNLRKLGEIEYFHEKLSSILDDEFKNAMSAILININQISNEITIVEEAMKEINLPQRISENTLKSYANINNQITEINSENKLYLKKKELDAEVKSANQKYTNIFMEQIAILKGYINSKMEELNTFVYGNEIIAPVLEVFKPNSYEFGTPVDSGTGTNYKNLVLFDLSTLQLTPLPALAHDTVIFKHIAQSPMGKIIELYEKHTKQTFIAIDETTKYPQTAQSIIKSKTIIQLSSGGNELYGESWVKKPKETT